MPDPLTAGPSDLVFVSLVLSELVAADVDHQVAPVGVPELDWKVIEVLDDILKSRKINSKKYAKGYF